MRSERRAGQIDLLREVNHARQHPYLRPVRPTDPLPKPQLTPLARLDVERAR
jgi:hypothetical protein